MATSFKRERGPPDSTLPLCSSGGGGASSHKLERPPSATSEGPRAPSPGGPPAAHQRPHGEGPPRGEGHLSHLLYSVALARNDKTRIAALLALEANCASLLPDTQKLHVAFTALDAIVCNSVPFTLKIGPSRCPLRNGDQLEGPLAGSLPRAAKACHAGGAPAGRGALQREASARRASANAGIEERPLRPQGTPEAPEETLRSPLSLTARGAAAEGDLDEQQRPGNPAAAGASRAASEGLSPSGGPPPSTNPGSCSSDSAPSPPSAAEAVSFVAASQGLGSNIRGLSPKRAAEGPPVEGGGPPSATQQNAGGPSLQRSRWLVVTRPFSVLSRVAAMQVWTSVSVVLDCLLVSPRWLERLVGLLHALAGNGGAADAACMRAFACSCLEELEMAYPGLLFPLLGPDGFCQPQMAVTLGTLQLCPVGAPRGPRGAPLGSPLFLKDLLEKETKETDSAAEAYASLLLRCCRHLAESVVWEGEAVKRWGEGAPARGPPEQQQQSAVHSLEDRQGLFGEAGEGPPGLEGQREEGGTQEPLTLCFESRQEPLHYAIPFVGVSVVPLPAITIKGSSRSSSSSSSSSSSRRQSLPPPRLVRGLGAFLRAALSLTLERRQRQPRSVESANSETVCLVLLCLPASASAALLQPFLFSSRMHLVHAWALLVEAAGDEGPGGPPPGGAHLGASFLGQQQQPCALLLADRLRDLAQDQVLNPHERTLAIRWLMALMRHPAFSEVLAKTPPSIFCPSAEDPPSVKEHLLQALLLYCSSSSSCCKRGTLANLYDVCGVMYEFICARRAPEVHAVVFRLLLRSMRSPKLGKRQLRAFLCDHLRCRPAELGPSVLLLLHHATWSLSAVGPGQGAPFQGPPRLAARAEITECLLLPLAEFLEAVEPPEDLLLFSPLLLRLATEAILPPSCLLGALKRLADTSGAADAAHSWRAGVCLLAVAKQLLLTHHVCSEVREGVGSLLGGLAKQSEDLDLRKGAAILLDLITHASPDALCTSSAYSLFTSTADDAGPLVERYLSHVSPPQYFFIGTVPFLCFTKSRRQRRVLCGLRDQQAAFFLAPRSSQGPPPTGAPPSAGFSTPPCMFDEQQEKASWSGDSATACFEQVYSDVHGEAAIEALAYGGAPPSEGSPFEGPSAPPARAPRPWALCPGPSAVDAYQEFVASHSFSVCVPFRLRVVEAHVGSSCCVRAAQGAPGAPLGGGPQATQGARLQGAPPLWVGDLYAVELSFSQCPSYRPLSSVLIPFLQSSLQTAVNAEAAELSAAEETLLARAADTAFPFNYEVILKLQPLEPIPASLQVAVRFSDASGAAYRGALEPFSVSFQDLFLPVCAPPEFRRVLFEWIWNRTDTARSVKTLDVEPDRVKKMVEMSLQPFLIEGPISVEPEAFDFYRDQCLHEPEEEASGAPGPPASLSFTVGPSAAPGSPAQCAAGEQLPASSVAAHADWSTGKEEEEGDVDSLTDAFADDYFDGQIPYPEILAGCTETPRALMEGPPPPSAGPPRPLETLHAIVFLPPKYHLLFKFTLSAKTTVARICTDRPQMLAYLDAFFGASFALTFEGAPP
ncbi:hypothetical protein Efla_006864 [Eimeria flavescens]